MRPRKGWLHMIALVIADDELLVARNGDPAQERLGPE